MAGLGFGLSALNVVHVHYAHEVISRAACCRRPSLVFCLEGPMSKSTTINLILGML